MSAPQLYVNESMYVHMSAALIRTTEELQVHFPYRKQTGLFCTTDSEVKVEHENRGKEIDASLHSKEAQGRETLDTDFSLVVQDSPWPQSLI